MIEPTFDLSRVGRWAVLRVQGEIDMATAPLLRQRVHSIATTDLGGLILDLGDIDFIDSTGLGVMVGAAKRLRMRQAELRIVCSQAHLLELFNLTRLDEVFDLFDTIDDALGDVAGIQR